MEKINWWRFNTKKYTYNTTTHTHEEPRQEVLQTHAHLTYVMYSKTSYQLVPFEKKKQNWS